MRTDRVAVALLALALPACAGPAAASDLDPVRALVRAPLPSELPARVDPEPDPEVEALLRQPLDEERAVRIALLNNRELRGALREVGVARGLREQAGLLPNPELEVEATPPRAGHGGTELETVLEYDLTHALLTPLRTSEADAAVEAARQRAAGAVVRLGFETRAAFYALQAAEQRLVLANRAL
ncbi:MAG: TolC family protein, partial [Myxococcales bacterium]